MTLTPLVGWRSGLEDRAPAGRLQDWRPSMPERPIPADKPPRPLPTISALNEDYQFVRDTYFRMPERQKGLPIYQRMKDLLSDPMATPEQYRELAEKVDEELHGIKPEEPDRLTFDNDTRTVTLDGARILVEDPKAYGTYKCIVEICRASPGNGVKNPEIQSHVAGLRGHNSVSRCLQTLPPQLRNTIETTTSGHTFRLPPL
jgi:hypothetical protein